MNFYYLEPPVRKIILQSIIHMSKQSLPEDEGLRREISMWALAANIFNIVVGAGIFVLPALVSRSMGVESLLAYLFCGFLMLLVVLCYAEVGSKITVTGGSYAFIYHTFGGMAGFITVILFFCATLTADAAVANALYEVVAGLIPAMNHSGARFVFLVVLFLGLGYLNVRGVKEGITLVKLTTLGKLIPLLILVVTGLFFIEPENLEWTGLPATSELAGISMLLFFAFQGAESGLTASGEVKDPQRSIPRALLISMIFIVLLYMLIQVVTLGVLGPELESFTENPLAETAGRFIGPFGFTLLTIGAAISMFGNISGEILNIPRSLFSSARDNTLPVPVLARIHNRFKTPYIAITVYVLIGLTLALFGGFAPLVIVSNSAILIIYIGIAAAVIKLRKVDDQPSAFRIPGGLFVPILTIIVILWFVSGLETIDIITGISLLIFLAILYAIIKRFKKP